MYIKRDEFGWLKYCAKLLMWEELYVRLHDDEKANVQKALRIIDRLERKREKENERQNERMKEYRKTNPKYFRSSKDWERYFERTGRMKKN